MSSGPRSFNLFSLFLLLCFAAGGYWTWKFFPHYFRAFQVDHILSEGANRSYKISRMREPLQSQSKQSLIEEMRKRVVELGVTDPEMTVGLDFEGEKVTATSDYTVVVAHVIEGKFTVIPFHRTATADLKKVDWGD
jgi:hypothetical protein